MLSGGAMAQSMTDFIDEILLEGGKIKDIHEAIKDEKKRQNPASRDYHSPGYFFNKHGDIQQRTLFGHIAHLILDNSSEIKFGDRHFDESRINGLRNGEYADHLNNLYENNEHIQLAVFNGKKNPACASLFNKASKVNMPDEHLPTKIDAENAHSALKTRGVKTSKKELLDQIEEDCNQKGLTLKDNWRTNTEENLAIWFPKK